MSYFKYWIDIIIKNGYPVLIFAVKQKTQSLLCGQNEIAKV